uniref:Uncharacterized protein n=1 Tax=Anguilla anguilla TaxID=7936 RepID=A0A0E9R4V4_ANGAN
MTWFVIYSGGIPVHYKIITWHLPCIINEFFFVS